MSSVETIRARVDAFLQLHTTGSLRPQDAFAPWFLVQQFRLPPQEAIAQSSDGNYDGGLDAYHLDRHSDGPPVLTLIQAKLTDQDGLVRKGIDDLRRAIDLVPTILNVGPTEMADEHRVVRNLRRALLALSTTERSALEVKCMLIHLLKDQELWLSKPVVQKARQEFIRAVGDGPLAGRATITFRGAAEMLDEDVIPRTAVPITLRFQGVTVDSTGTDKALFGLGHLADLVDLHEKYRADLFAKNVRMYLARQAKKPKSAASHIEQSLAHICDGKMPAPQFAMTHNGVALTVPRVIGPEAGKLTLEPGQGGIYVLNGCQTVYTAWKYFKSRMGKKSEGSWREEWEAIRLPMRIIVTGDEDLVRTVTIGANRQTEIKPSAFWAHDYRQLDLESRFARQHIFYERQDGAWDEIERSDPAKAETFSCGKVNIDEIARVIAAADRTLSIEFAKSPNKIFDDENTYAKVFKDKNIASVRLLLFLTNTFKATELVLRDLSNDVAKLQDLKPSQFVFPVFRVLVHWISKKNRELVSKFADYTVSTSPKSEIRKCIRQWLTHHHSGLQQLLPEVWWDHDKECWEAMERERLLTAFHKLKLDNTMLFDGWDEFDERADEE